MPKKAWSKYFARFSFFGFKTSRISYGALVLCDNKVALYNATCLIFHEQTKYIEIDCHIVREKLQANIIKTLHIGPKHKLSDLFTRALSCFSFLSLLSKMGVLNKESSYR